LPTNVWLIAIVALLLVIAVIGIAILVQLNKNRQSTEDVEALVTTILDRDTLGKVEDFVQRLGYAAPQIARQGGLVAGEEVAIQVLGHLGYDVGQPALPVGTGDHAEHSPDPSYQGVPHAGHPYDQGGQYPAHPADWQPDNRPVSGSQHGHHSHHAPVSDGRSLMVALTRGGVREPGEPPAGFTRVQIPGAPDAQDDGGYGYHSHNTEAGHPNAQTLTIPKYEEPEGDGYDELVRQPGETEEQFQKRRDAALATFQAALDRDLVNTTGGFRMVPGGGLMPARRH
jgi:hypothetical protein